MKQDEVPQDRLDYYGEQRKAVYALDASGRYSTVASSGWSVEAAVTGDAIAEFERLAAEQRARVERGERSPLAYHMYARRMDLPTLAQSAGSWRWRVWLDLLPAVYARIGRRRLLRYADALGLPAEALRRLP